MSNVIQLKKSFIILEMKQNGSKKLIFPLSSDFSISISDLKLRNYFGEIAVTAKLVDIETDFGMK
jgi:hypothetical protein